MDAEKQNINKDTCSLSLEELAQVKVVGSNRPDIQADETNESPKVVEDLKEQLKDSREHIDLLEKMLKATVMISIKLADL